LMEVKFLEFSQNYSSQLFIENIPILIVISCCISLLFL
jgi:hypothetical protein